MTTKPPVFINEQYQARFESKGYVVVPTFLSPIDLTRLNSFYEEHTPKANGGFYVTNWLSDLEYNRKAHGFIKEALVEKLEKLLKEYKPVLGCFAVKESGGDNSMGLHQDWSVV